jgi:DNA-binding NarL/FixJ family response regulator
MTRADADLMPIVLGVVSPILLRRFVNFGVAGEDRARDPSPAAHCGDNFGHSSEVHPLPGRNESEWARLMNDTEPITMSPRASATILVIDEQLLLSSALAYSLQGQGLDAHSIRITTLEGVQREAREYVPGLVLLDLDLGSGPDCQPIDSVDLIAPLCAQGWTVMVLTGTVNLNRIGDAIARGATNWIVKGATFSELVHAAVEIMAGRGRLLPADRDALIERHREVQANPKRSIAGIQLLQ